MFAECSGDVVKEKGIKKEKAERNAHGSRGLRVESESSKV
jgi:hypothetical protein